MTHEQPPSRRPRIRKLLLVVAGSAVLLTVPSCLATAWRTLQDTTYYAPGYSEWKFRSVRPRMHESEVILLLGQPLQIRPVVPRIYWDYLSPTLRVSASGGRSGASGTFDLWRCYTLITADQAGRIINGSGGFLPINTDDLVGQSLTDVRKRFGEPHTVYEQPSSKYLVYSGTKVSGSYYTREVGLDAEGRVNSIIAGWYQD